MHSSAVCYCRFGTSFFTGSGTKDFEAGSSSLGALITTGNSQVQNCAALTLTTIREKSLAVEGGNVTVSPNGTSTATSNLHTLSVTAPGRMDLKDNDMVLTNMPIGTWNGATYTSVLGLVAWLASAHSSTAEPAVPLLGSARILSAELTCGGR